MKNKNGVHYISKNICKKIVRKLGKNSPDTTFIFNLSNNAKAKIVYCGDVSNPVSVFNEAFIPAYTVNDLLMPDGIFARLMDKKLEDPEVKFVEKTSTLCNIFTTLWHEASWKEAEAYLNSLVS